MRHRWRPACLLALAALAHAGSVQAQAWPNRPIKAYIPFSAGSATDIIPRTVFEPLAAALGQPIVVENRGGAGGTIGVGAVVKAEPDGYTLLANSSAHTIAPWIVPNLPYDTARDLAGVAAFGKNANVLVVPLDRGWKTVADMVAAARSRPQGLTYGSAGVGTATHMSAERLRLAAGIEAVHVPYKGGPEVLADILAGRIDFYYCPISTAVPLIREKRLVALAVSTPTRASVLPDLPTSVEAGYPNSDYTIWYAMFAPAKTPAEIIARLHDATTAVLQSPQFKPKLEQLALEPMPVSPAELDAQVAREIADNESLVKAAGVK